MSLPKLSDHLKTLRGLSSRLIPAELNLGVGMLLWMDPEGRTYVAPLGTPYPTTSNPYESSPAWMEVEA